MGMRLLLGKAPFYCMLIVFSGMDGAGKSTQIMLLRKSLHERGVRVHKIWIRGGYTPIFVAFKALIRWLGISAIPKPGASPERSRHLSSSHVRKVWLVIAMADLVFITVVVLRMQLAMGRTVICDRYLEDTLLDFRRNFPQEDVASWWLWRLLLRAAVKPDYRFLLLVPPVESARRSRLKNEPFPDSTETLEWRYKAYQEMARDGCWRHIDCRRPIADVYNDIEQELQS